MTDIKRAWSGFFFFKFYFFFGFYYFTMLSECISNDQMKFGIQSLDNELSSVKERIYLLSYENTHMIS